MGELRKLDLGSGRSIYVEVDDVDAVLQGSGSGVSADSEVPDRPRGAQLTSFGDKVEDAAEAIRSNIDAMASLVHNCLEAYSPDEWGVELSIGFKGKAGIPVLVSGEASGSVKVSAKWKRSR